MKALLIALALLAPPGAHYQGTVGTGATAPPATISDVGYAIQSTTASTITVTINSIIPAGAIVVALATQSKVDAGNTVTSANLTFTNRQRISNSPMQASVFTAVAASQVASGEVFTHNAITGTSQPALSIYVITGADTGSLTVVGTSTSGSSSVMSPSISVTRIGSYLLAAGRNYDSWVPTLDANTTTVGYLVTGYIDTDWHFRRSLATITTGATPFGSTNATNAIWAATAIEIRPQ